MYKTDDSLVMRAMKLATEHHSGQVDKAGMPYIEHCIRVGVLAGFQGKTKEEISHLIAIGFLHDIIEDTELTPDQLSEQLGNEEVVAAVMLLSRIKEQTYFEYIDEVAENKLATLVKLADIEDHLVYENGFVLPESLEFRYKKAKEQLLQSSQYLKHIGK